MKLIIALVFALTAYCTKRKGSDLEREGPLKKLNIGSSVSAPQVPDEKFSLVEFLRSCIKGNSQSFEAFEQQFPIEVRKNLDTALYISQVQENGLLVSQERVSPISTWETNVIFLSDLYGLEEIHMKELKSSMKKVLTDCFPFMLERVDIRGKHFFLMTGFPREINVPVFKKAIYQAAFQSYRNLCSYQKSSFKTYIDIISERFLLFSIKLGLHFEYLRKPWNPDKIFQVLVDFLLFGKEMQALEDLYELMFSVFPDQFLANFSLDQMKSSSELIEILSFFVTDKENLKNLSLVLFEIANSFNDIRPTLSSEKVSKLKSLRSGKRAFIDAALSKDSHLFMQAMAVVQAEFDEEYFLNEMEQQDISKNDMQYFVRGRDQTWIMLDARMRGIVTIKRKFKNMGTFHLLDVANEGINAYFVYALLQLLVTDIDTILHLAELFEDSQNRIEALEIIETLGIRVKDGITIPVEELLIFNAASVTEKTRDPKNVNLCKLGFAFLFAMGVAHFQQPELKPRYEASVNIIKTYARQLRDQSVNTKMRLEIENSGETALINNDNGCFINSAFHALMRIPAIQELVSKASIKIQDSKIMHDLKKLVRQVRLFESGQGEQLFAVSNFHSSVRKEMNIAPYVQADANEALQVILNALQAQEIFSEFVFDGFEGPFELIDNTGAVFRRGQVLTKFQSLSLSVFPEVLLSRMQEKGMFDARKMVMDIVSELNFEALEHIISNLQLLSFDALINEYFAEDKTTGCRLTFDQIEIEGTCKSRNTVETLPRLLHVQVNRVINVQDDAYHVFIPVEIPLEIKSIGKHECDYRLESVILFRSLNNSPFSSGHFGHYVSLVRNTDSELWTLYDDLQPSKVERFSWHAVKEEVETNSYGLVYRKVE